MTTDLVLSNSNEKDIFLALKDTIYRGASDSSINMVLSYCKALTLDPLMKPVHIGQIEGKDVVMPGIGLYRTMAHRSGEYMGISEPIFGPTITAQLGSVTVSYPEWCSITVYKFVKGQIASFSSKKLWTECYGSKKGTSEPNRFWRTGPFSMLEKCTEVASLRKAFPEIISHGETFEEKTMILDDKSVSNDPKIHTSTAASVKEKLKASKVETLPSPTKEHTIYEVLIRLIEEAFVPKEEVEKWLTKAGVSTIYELTTEQTTKLCDMLDKRIEKIGNITVKAVTRNPVVTTDPGARNAI